MTQERCKATHVVQCDFRLDYPHDQHSGFIPWKNGDPQPRIEVTPEHIGRFRAVANKLRATAAYLSDEDIAACLEAAFNGDTE